MGQPDGPRGPPSLAREKQTRGTETSQYPEEEKATAIPLVAASERGPAQTRGACTSGVVGPRHGSTTPSRSGLERPAGGRVKASLNRGTRYVAVDPKPWRSTLEQVEAAVTGGGGPNRCGLKTARMT